MSLDERLGNLILGAEERGKVLESLASLRLFRYHSTTDGTPSFCSRLEGQVARLLGTPNVLALTSCSAGLHAALVGVGVTPGDLVAIPGYSFLGTATCVLAAGAIPVFVDVDDGYGMCPEDLGRVLRRPIKAVVAVSLQGMACRLAEIQAECCRVGVPLVEDAAQALGARTEGGPVGTIGTVGVFSLQANKVVTCGEGGLLTTAEPRLYEKIRSIHDWGCVRPDGEIPVWEPTASYGFNYKLADPLAAIALAQLDKLDEIISLLRAREAAFVGGLGSIARALRRGSRGDVSVPTSVCLDLRRAGWTGDLQEFVTQVSAFGGYAKALYPTPLYRHPIFVNRASPYANGFPFNLTDERYDQVSLPGVEDACQFSAWFPINPVIDVEDYERWGVAVRNLFGNSH